MFKLRRIRFWLRLNAWNDGNIRVSVFVFVVVVCLPQWVWSVGTVRGNWSVIGQWWCIWAVCDGRSSVALVNWSSHNWSGMNDWCGVDNWCGNDSFMYWSYNRGNDGSSWMHNCMKNAWIRIFFLTKKSSNFGRKWKKIQRTKYVKFYNRKVVYILDYLMMSEPRRQLECLKRLNQHVRLKGKQRKLIECNQNIVRKHWRKAFCLLLLFP